MQRIYLDHNATTSLAPEAEAAMAEAYGLGPANPASSHSFGRQARQALEDAREQIAKIVGARLGGSLPDRVVFTSGGTEANNLALLGLATSRGQRVLVSAIEHPSVTESADELERVGFQVVRLGVTGDGVARLDQLEDLLAEDAAFVSLMLANNETGVVQPVAAAAALCAGHGALLHTDAVQAIGKFDVDFQSLGAAAMTISGHKIGGPVGIGALVLRGDVPLTPRTFGGFQQAAIRPGTEPVALVVGMAAALTAWEREKHGRRAHLAALRDEFESVLQASCPELVVNGAAAPRVPHTSNLAFVGVEREALQIALDLAGIACSTGSACASGSTDPSPALVAMGCPRAVFESSLRFSFAPTTTPAEATEAARRILRIYNDLRTASERRKMPGPRRVEGLNSL